MKQHWINTVGTNTQAKHVRAHIRTGSTVQIVPSSRQSASSSLLQPAELAPTLTTITTIVNNPQYVFTWGFQKPEKKKKEWGEKKKNPWKNEGMCFTSVSQREPSCLIVFLLEFALDCFGRWDWVVRWIFTPYLWTLSLLVMFFAFLFSN